MQRLTYRIFLAGKITHVGIVVRHPNGALALLEAAHWQYPVMLSDIGSRLNFYKGPVWVRRLRCPLSEAQSARLTAFAAAQDGKRFWPAGLLLPTFGRPTRNWGIRCTGRKGLDGRKWYCSALVVATGVRINLFDPCVVRPNFTTPNDLYDDRFLDLSCTWTKPIRLRRSPGRTSGWWSQSTSGKWSYWE